MWKWILTQRELFFRVTISIGKDLTIAIVHILIIEMILF
jgi:hypothetical protein